MRGVATLGVATTTLAYWLDRSAPGSGPSGLVRWTALLVAVASGLFLTAGVLRLVKWRLVGDAHSALIGTALVVIGGLCLPLVSFTRVFLVEDHLLVGSLARCAATFIVMSLVLVALYEHELHPRHRPARLLPRLVALVALVFVGLLALAAAAPEAFHRTPLSAAVPPASLSLGWLTVATLAARRGTVLPWARRAAPLMLGMAIAEMMRAIDRGQVGAWTFAAVLVAAVMAVLAARSALLDLDRALREEETELAQLSSTLVEARGQAHDLTVWREQLTHDARSAVAGLRAAMEILERYDGRVQPSATQQLRLAAAQEIGHLEHLLTRSAAQACEDFDIGEVVERVGKCARALGAPVSVHAVEALGHGRPGDLAAVLKNLLVNAQTHAPGSRVDIHVEACADTVRIICTDDGPGLTGEDADRVFERGFRSATSPGSGLGLYAARELMREQDGDLVLSDSLCGATFVLTLPAAARPATRAPHTVRVPIQRFTSSLPVHGLARQSAAAVRPADTGALL